LGELGFGSAVQASATRNAPSANAPGPETLGPRDDQGSNLTNSS